MIRVQEQAAKMTRQAIEALLRTSRHVPEDKIDWRPMGSARTTMDMLSECIQFAEGLCTLLTADFMPTNFPREQMMARRQQILEQYKTPHAIEELAHARYGELVQVILNTPDSRLEQEFQLPFARGRAMTGADMLFLAYWNLVYHTGQINYIQTMLGDMEMH